MQIYDITSAAVDDEQVVLALFDNRHNSVMIIRATEDGKLETTEPDGAERLYWLEKFGMVTEEEFQAEVAKVKSRTGREKLYELLKGEFE